MRKLLFILLKLIPKLRQDYLKQSVKVHRSTNLVYKEQLHLGKYVYIGPNCFLNAEGGIEIGSGTILAPEVVILSSSHDYTQSTLLPYDIYDVHRKVIIGRGVWIGYRAMICPGVRIGDGAVIAMGAVVVRDVAEGEVVGGNPAVTLKTRPLGEVKDLIEANKFFHKVYWTGNRPRQVSHKHNLT